MQGLSRVGDIWAGVCFCHKDPVPMAGPIMTGSPSVSINNRPAARRGDLVIGYCGHVGFIVGSSTDTEIDYRGAGRIGDPVAGCMTGVIVLGSGDVTNG